MANCYKDLSLDLNVVIVSGVLKISGIEILAGLLSDGKKGKTMALPSF